jgi:hypothetical protein
VILGCVVRIKLTEQDSTTSLGARALVRVLLECDLSAPLDVDLWRVLVSGIVSGRSVFAGQIPKIEELLEAQGVGSP